MSPKRIFDKSQRIAGWSSSRKGGNQEAVRISTESWVVDYISKHPGVFAAPFVGLGVILNERSGRQDIKDDFGVKIDLVRTEMATKTDLAELKAELKAESAHTQSIVLGSAYATMKALSGDRKMMTTWMKDIENCVTHGGQACDPIKGIATVYAKGKKD